MRELAELGGGARTPERVADDNRDGADSTDARAPLRTSHDVQFSERRRVPAGACACLSSRSSPRRRGCCGRSCACCSLPTQAPRRQAARRGARSRATGGLMRRAAHGVPARLGRHAACLAPLPAAPSPAASPVDSTGSPLVTDVSASATGGSRRRSFAHDGRLSVARCAWGACSLQPPRGLLGDVSRRAVARRSARRPNRLAARCRHGRLGGRRLDAALVCARRAALCSLRRTTSHGGVAGGSGAYQRRQETPETRTNHPRIDLGALTVMFAAFWSSFKNRP